jgi:hypothetical protein
MHLCYCRQGPSYALAKRIQHWRAIVARERHNCAVSSNVAPSTATASVTSNRLFAMAYGGMHWFRPFEVFQQETSNAVMGALLLRDINDKNVRTAINTVKTTTTVTHCTSSTANGVTMTTSTAAAILLMLLVRVCR